MQSSITPVSYTHLDVYKRQASACATPAAWAGQAPTSSSDYIPGGRIPLLQGDIAIDGELDDAAWDGALVQEIAYDIQPGDNTPAPVKTTVRIGYTRDALYLSLIHI